MMWAEFKCNINLLTTNFFLFFHNFWGLGVGRGEGNLFCQFKIFFKKNPKQGSYVNMYVLFVFSCYILNRLEMFKIRH